MNPAYVCENGLVTPWSNGAMGNEDGAYCDSFNCWQSSHIIQVDQAFCVLVNRWGTVRRPMLFRIPDCLIIGSVVMRFHNFAIEEDGMQQPEDYESHDDRECAETSFKS